MTDLTDSFCERCGARYAFVSNAPKGLSLKGARVLAKGLKNFVFTDGQSISDAMALARNEDSTETSSRIVEAFHRTFNFCMTCRQYACDRCWNAAAGECLSCAPAPESASAAGGAGRPQGRPFAPEDLPILQGSTAPVDAEWSLFAETPIPVSNQSGARPAPSSEMAVVGELHQEKPRQRPAPTAWPAADLAEIQQAKVARSNGGSGRNGHDSSRKRGDGDAAIAWPVTDEIAPEMALTPEELQIVETRLSQVPSDVSPEPVAAAAETETAPQEPLLVQAAAAETETAPQEPLLVQAAAAETETAPQEPLLAELRTWWNASAPVEASAPDWSLDAIVTDDRPAGDVEVEASPAGVVPAEVAEPEMKPQEDRAAQPSALEPDLPPVSTKLLLRTEMSGVLPPLTPSQPQPASPEPLGLIARLLGRRAPANDPTAASRPMRAGSGRNRRTGESWPRATAWSERRLEGRHWWLDAGAPPSESGAATVDQAAAPDRVGSLPAVTPEVAEEAVPEPRRAVQPRPRTERSGRPARGAPAAVPAAQMEIDPRAAAALRLSAVESAMGPAAAAAGRKGAAADVPPVVPSEPVDLFAPAEAAAASRPSFDLPVASPPRRPAPAHEPAWVRVQREAAEPEPSRTRLVPDEVAAHDSGEKFAAQLPAAPEQAAFAAQMPAAPEPAAPKLADPVPAAPEPAAQMQAVQPAAARPEPKTHAAPPPATSDIPAQAPVAPWPPLGASWPTREKPGAPWPAPDTTPVPAIVAAAQVQVPTLAEMWVQSAQEVVNRGSVRVCHHCALQVSTKARFCRRCGTQQV